MIVKFTPLIALALFLAVHSSGQTPSTVTHTVGRGDSLYSLVAEYYPKRMANWTDVAADLVALNPDVLPQGLDTVMNLGDVLTLVEYDDGPPSSAYTTSDNEVVEDTRSDLTTATPTRVAEDAPEPAAQPSKDVIDDDIQNAVDVIGRVMKVSQASSAIDQNNEQRAISLNEYVYLGDSITTESNASVTIRLIDDAEVTLFSSSRVMFEHYQHDADQQRGSAVLTLVKGGFRMKTGLLGRQHPESIAVNTAVATVGVKGTEFALRVCAPDSCRVTPSSDKLAAGLYAGVLEGEIELSNNTGKVQTRRAQFYHVAAPNAAPKPALQAAGLLFGPEELALLNVDVEEERPLSFLGWLKRKLFGD